MELVYHNAKNRFVILKIFEPFEHCQKAFPVESYSKVFYVVIPVQVKVHLRQSLWDELRNHLITRKKRKKADHSQEYIRFLPMECHHPERKGVKEFVATIVIVAKLYLIDLIKLVSTATFNSPSCHCFKMKRIL